LASPKWPLRRCLTSTQHFFISTDLTLYGSTGYCACIPITLSWAWTCLSAPASETTFVSVKTPKVCHIHMSQIIWVLLKIAFKNIIFLFYKKEKIYPLLK
jgi:hypothetical protein